MNIKYLNTILSIILLSYSPNSTPIRDSYTIEMPTHLDLSDSGSFNIKLVENLTEGDTVNISFDDTFTLTDAHGKDDITGSLNVTSVSFNEDDVSDKTINYVIDNLSAGDWSGNIDVTISLDRSVETNVLKDGETINGYLKTLSPTSILFSHDEISGDYSYDLSSAKDESILLYMNGTQAIITNNSKELIKMNNDMSYLFANLSITKIENLSYLDTSECEDMSHMFENCTAIKTLDVSSLDTSSVINMSYMFASMSKCTTITGLDSFDVSNVVDLSYLLYNNLKLTSVPDLSGWDITNKCKNIAYMMANIAYTPKRNGYSKWPSSVDYSGWDVSGVTNMSGTFRNAFMLNSLNISGWDTSKVKDMSHMFEMDDTTERSRLASIIGLDSLDVSAVEDMSYMFKECRSLSSDFSSWRPTSVTSLAYTFSGNRKLDLHTFDCWPDYIDLSNIDTTNCFSSYAGSEVDKTYIPWS